MAVKTSVCSKKARVAYYWRECTGEHVAETVSKLMSVVENRYQLSDHQSVLCQVAFEDRLGAAQRGRLTPGDHVKTIRQDPTVDMFEMRWADLSVTPRDPVTGLYGAEVLAQMRLYYVETGQQWVVGLYCHEKEILDGDRDGTAAAQDWHIEQALAIHHGTAHRSWGVPIVPGLPRLDTPV